jgi:predicted RNase H-like nuclease
MGDEPESARHVPASARIKNVDTIVSFIFDKQRPVERELMKIFAAYEAGPYPANFSNRAFQQAGWIQQFVKVLENLGFKHQPKLTRQQPQQTFLEVFPSPAQVILFPQRPYSLPFRLLMPR